VPGILPRSYSTKIALTWSLLQQRLDRALCQLLVLVRQINQVRSAIGGDHYIRLGGVLSEQAVAGLGVGIVGNARVLVVRVEQRQLKRLCKIDRKKAHRQEILGRILVTGFRCGAGLALL